MAFGGAVVGGQRPDEAVASELLGDVGGPAGEAGRGLIFTDDLGINPTGFAAAHQSTELVASYSAPDSYLGHQPQSSYA
jgi:hypothetical protein